MQVIFIASLQKTSSNIIKLYKLMQILRPWPEVKTFALANKLVSEKKKVCCIFPRIIHNPPPPSNPTMKAFWFECPTLSTLQTFPLYELPSHLNSHDLPWVGSMNILWNANAGLSLRAGSWWISTACQTAFASYFCPNLHLWGCKFKDFFMICSHVLQLIHPSN